MDEVWHLLGISECPDCLIRHEDMGQLDVAATPRRFDAALAAVRAARAEAALGYGHKLTAKALLKEQGLLAMHLWQWNPFFFVPHAEYDCFPMDRLHGVYVGLARSLILS